MNRFNEDIGITGAILTKMDGDTRGGSALSVRGVSGKPIKFVGVGEGLDDLEPFYPERMASRILGQGDIATLLEKAKVRKKLCTIFLWLDIYLNRRMQLIWTRLPTWGKKCRKEILISMIIYCSCNLLEN